jgi:hypothetical protein
LEFRIILESSIYSVVSDMAQARSILFARGTNFDASEVLGRLMDSLVSCPIQLDESFTVSKHTSESSVLVRIFDFPSAPNGTTMNHNTLHSVSLEHSSHKLDT